MELIIMIATRIQGIPCQVQATHVFVQKPLGPNCDSDWDASGYSEVEFAVFDTKGYPAAWLEKKMTDADTARIETLILENQHDD
jgi:hypothetical protein